MSKTPLEQLKEVHEIQGNPGNRDYDPYMLGMFNGLELALAIFQEREPQYKSAPKKWGKTPIEEPETWLAKMRAGWGKSS